MLSETLLLEFFVVNYLIDPVFRLIENGASCKFQIISPVYEESAWNPKSVSSHFRSSNIITSSFFLVVLDELHQKNRICFS